MMGIVVFVMGSAVALAGWRGRTLATTNAEVALKNRADHRKIAPLMYIFLVSGYTGGVLSLVMQGQPILESPHFLTGTIVIALLTINAILAATGFIGNKETARTVHAYVGSVALLIMVVHAVLGLNLGLSI
jgi:fucose 4-O-acetylase-like acetyltransferase